MSYCKEEGKDKIIFVTEEDHSAPSNLQLNDEEEEEEEEEGLIKANGEINFDCPCLQGMAYGPCGEDFKSAFSCFHYSEAEPKGVDCIEQFRSMQDCFQKYPELYGNDDDDEKSGKDFSEIEEQAADKNQPSLNEESRTVTNVESNKESAS